MLRNPRVTFFTFVFPLMFLVIFSAINGDVMVPGASGGDVRFAQFYAPSIGIFGLTLACYTNVIFGLATARDERLLKRVRGTPLPMPTYLGSWLTGAMLLGMASVSLMIVGRRAGLRRRPLPADCCRPPWSRSPSARLRSPRSGSPWRRSCATPTRPARWRSSRLLPLSFISGIWWPLDGAPDWITAIAHAFPLYHLVQAFDACFVPQTTGSGFAGATSRWSQPGAWPACSSPSGASRRSRTRASTSG